MKPIPVIAIFDIGKTNKKLFLFDEDYRIVFESSARLNEVEDEDGFPCESVDTLRQYILNSLSEVNKLKDYELKAVNFSAYGASFVYLDNDGRVIAPLYNYLKPYPEELKKQFYDAYGDEEKFSFQTASPALGNLNSGLQLYRVKYQNPDLFKRLKYALHLPQYLGYLVTGKTCSDVTSIGCHTALWDYKRNSYHDWVVKEGIIDKLAPIAAAGKVMQSSIQGAQYKSGIGLHDSSSALIPYLRSFNEFILLSTGTWSVSLNPFNQSPLTTDQLQHDCLNYIQHDGKTVRASRLFSGYEYDEQVERIASYFNQDITKYGKIKYEATKLNALPSFIGANNTVLEKNIFKERNLAEFQTDMDAYYQLIGDMVYKQKISTEYVLEEAGVNKIFVDGGFSKNEIYMHLLTAAFPQLKVFSASISQATALGAALAIHNGWNKKPIQNDLIGLKHYAAQGR